MKVLIIDHSERVGKKVAALLHSIAPLQLLPQATDAPMALQLGAHFHPDIILLDLQLPGGFRLARHLRSLLPQAKLVLFSNFENQFYRSKLQPLNADFILDKTKEFERLRELLLQLAAAADIQLHNPS